METYRSPLFLAKLVISGLVVIGICRLLLLFAGIGFAVDSSRVFELGANDSMSIWALVMGLVSLLLFPAFIYTVVVFLMWLYRTVSNLPALRSDSTEFTPGWAVGWWFIPIANLFKPFQAVRTVWAESDPDVDLEGEGFLTSIQSSAPTFMVFWWGLYLVSNIFSNIASRLGSVAKPGEESIIGVLVVIEAVLWIAAAYFAIRVVWSITERQDMRSARVGIQTRSEPPPPPTFEN